MARRQHQERVLCIIQCLEGEEALQPEQSVPQASRHIDGLVLFDEPNEAWGPIRPLLYNRQVLVEHFSRPPSLKGIVRVVAKLGYLTEQWWHQGSKKKVPKNPPMLLILSKGKSRKALSLLSELPSLSVDGVWLAPRPVLGDLLFIDFTRLSDKQPGTSVLRLMGSPESPEEARARIDGLLHDPGVLESTKSKLLESLMNGTIPSNPQEQESLLECARREGRQEGRQEGRREALLSIAEAKLGSKQAQSLAKLESVEELEAVLLRVLSED